MLVTLRGFKGLILCGELWSTIRSNEMKPSYHIELGHYGNLSIPLTMIIVAPVWSLNNPVIPMSDQDRISPYNINTILSRRVMRIKKNIS